MSLLRPLRSFIGVFQRLFGMFVSGLVIAFRVVRGRSPVCVRSKLVELGSSLVRVIWHKIPHPWWPYSLIPSYVWHCSIVNRSRGHRFPGRN